MKKVLFTIMAAVVLMSCGGSANDPEISANDKKAMKKASCDAVAQLGEKSREGPEEKPEKSRWAICETKYYESIIIRNLNYEHIDNRCNGVHWKFYRRRSGKKRHGRVGGCEKHK